jgi:hypothetical protein
MTRTTPLRRTTLQLRQIFFTDASTFMAASFALSAVLGRRSPTPFIQFTPRL